MKRFFLLMFVAGSAIFESACNNDKEDKENNTQPSSDSYYVKYQAASGNSMWYLKSITVTTDDGLKTFTDGWIQNWTQTYGPVSKGFQAKISASGGNPTVQIYVCKGKEPFAIKQTNSGNGSASASYIIDF